MRAFARTTPLTDIVGRQDYITNEDRQEHIVLTYNKDYDFKPYADYEKGVKKNENQKSRDGREWIFKLPNSWSDKSEQELQSLCKEIAEGAIKKDTDYCFAVHWNKDKTNLHLHIVFSEREVSTEKYKRYKRDVWMTKDGLLAKSKAERHTLKHRKGDIKVDRNGNPVVEDREFTSKNDLYSRKHYAADTLEWYKGFLKDKGIELDKAWINQRHIGKGLPAEKKQFMVKYNDLAYKINNRLNELEKLNPGIGDGVIKRTQGAFEKDSEFGKNYIYSLEGLESLDSLTSSILECSDRVPNEKMSEISKDYWKIAKDQNNFKNVKGFNRIISSISLAFSEFKFKNKYNISPKSKRVKDIFNSEKLPRVNKDVYKQEIEDYEVPDIYNTAKKNRLKQEEMERLKEAKLKQLEIDYERASKALSSVELAEKVPSTSNINNARFSIQMLRNADEYKDFKDDLIERLDNLKEENAIYELERSIKRSRNRGYDLEL